MISSRPYWLDTVTEADFRLPGRPPADELPPRAQVAIIGGGIVGLACAHSLAEAGVDQVVLLERGELLHEASGANGGGLWPGQQAAGAGTFSALGRASLELIASFAARADADLEFRRNGVLEVARSDQEATSLQERTLAARAAGLPVDWLPPTDACELEPALAPSLVAGAAWHPEDAHLNPAQLGAAFARSALRGGARLVTGAPVRALEQMDGRARLLTVRGTVEAAHVVVTAGAWTKEFGRFLGLSLPVEPAKGDLLATEPAPGLLRHSVFSTYGLIGTAGGRIITGGTVEFVGFDAEPRAETRERIWAAARELVPALHGRQITHAWARFRPHTPDELPLIGRCGADGRHLVAAGHFKSGLLLSAVTGRIVADLLTRGESSYPLRGLEPDRFTVPQQEGR